MLHPDEWIAREADFPYYAIDKVESPFPHWEDEEKAGGGSLHLSTSSRVRQLAVIKGALRKLLLCGHSPPSGESGAATAHAEDAPLGAVASLSEQMVGGEAELSNTRTPP